MSKKILTLVLIQREGKILLGMKKRGFGKGRWNGFGGKVEKGETIEEGAKRETKEECGVEILEMEKVGILDFEFQKNLGEILSVHVFKAEEFSGNAIESEEMKPAWYDEHEIPFELMWPDDKFWFPLFFEKKKFEGKFLFGEGDNVIKYKLKKVKKLSK